MGRLRPEGRAYAAQTWRARMASTRTSERFLGSRGSRSCETMSWVSGTTKTVRGGPGQCAFQCLRCLHRFSFGVIWSVPVPSGVRPYVRLRRASPLLSDTDAASSVAWGVASAEFGVDGAEGAEGAVARWRTLSSPAGPTVAVLISRVSVLKTELTETSVELCQHHPDRRCGRGSRDVGWEGSGGSGRGAVKKRSDRLV